MAETKLSFYEASQAWQGQLEKRLNGGIKELLEKKHLYQSVAIEIADTLEQLKARLENPQHEYQLTSQIRTLRRSNWIVVDPTANPQSWAPGKQPILMKIPDVKLFCETCDRTEAFNLVSAEAFLERGKQSDVVFGSTVVQVFAASFLCQSCKRIPEAFLIRRTGEKLTLCGRTPMEVAHVPSVIPKAIHRFYGGAVIAHQSGQTLAGVFMLRTVIEQWARSQVKDPPNQADQLMDAYMATLPPDFNQRFSSMRTLYGDLSVDVHSATGSAELFERATDAITEHFGARRLFKLDV
jgi:hypothetical protein